MKKPIISENFNLDDIRKIREYENERMQGMTASEISDYIHKGAEEGYRILEQLRGAKVSTVN